MRVINYVIDASVGVKWFSLEENRLQALKILNDLEKGKCKLFAPELLLYEVINALWKGKRLGVEDLKIATNDLLEIGIRFCPISQFLAYQAIEFMVKYDLTFYDAVYGALAFFNNAPLISANPKHHKKIKEIKVIPIEKYQKFKNFKK